MVEGTSGRSVGDVSSVVAGDHIYMVMVRCEYVVGTSAIVVMMVYVVSNVVIELR